MYQAIDMHCDTISCLWKLRQKGTPQDLRSCGLSVDLEKMRQGNYLLQNFAMFVMLRETTDPLQNVLELIDEYYRQLEENQDLIAPVYTSADIERNRSKGLLSALLTVEEGGVCKGSLEVLRSLYRLGVRMMTLTWNFENEIAYPNYVYEEVPRPDTERGLKPFGFEAINKMWDLGIIVDVSHLNDAGIYDVLDNARKPIVASHSNSRAVMNVPRNMTDDMIRRLARNGGIMGMNYCPNFVSKNDKQNQIPDIVEHIKHIADIGGIETVALGSDFDGIPTPVGMSDCTKTHDLYEALRQNNFSQEDIDRIFYKNFLRVLEANQK